MMGDVFLVYFATKEWGLPHWQADRFEAGLTLLRAGGTADDWRVFMYGC